MKELYFIDEEHRRNLESMFFMFPVARKDLEYKTACYILSVPMIFDKVQDYINDFSSPVEWILNYLEWEEQFEEEWYSYKSDDDSLHPEHEKWISIRPYDLSYSMKQLGLLSLNLWTSYDDFNLMKCLSALDEKGVNVVRCAIDVRMKLI